MHSALQNLIQLAALGLGLGIIYWGAVASLHQEATNNKGTAEVVDLPKIKSPPEIPSEVIRSLSSIRIQGKPEPKPAEPQVQASTKPPTTLPAQFRLLGIFYTPNASLALFSTGIEKVRLVEGEEVLDIKVVQIKESEVVVRYREKEFTLKVSKGVGQ